MWGQDYAWVFATFLPAFIHLTLTHTHTDSLLGVILSYLIFLNYNAYLQLRGARSALQGAAGSWRTVLRVG